MVNSSLMKGVRIMNTNLYFENFKVNGLCEIILANF